MFAPKVDGSSLATTIWDELPSVSVSFEKLEYLFENRAKDFLSKVRRGFALIHISSSLSEISMKKKTSYLKVVLKISYQR